RQDRRERPGPASAVQGADRGRRWRGRGRRYPVELREVPDRPGRKDRGPVPPADRARGAGAGHRDRGEPDGLGRVREHVLVSLAGGTGQPEGRVAMGERSAPWRATGRTQASRPGPRLTI